MHGTLSENGMTVIHLIVPKKIGRAFRHLADFYTRTRTAQFCVTVMRDNNDLMRLLTDDERARFLKGKLIAESTEHYRRVYPRLHDVLTQDAAEPSASNLIGKQETAAVLATGAAGLTDDESDELESESGDAAT
jgi:hypothetical protein